MKNRRRISKRSTSSGNRSHQFDSIVHAICVVLSLVLAVCAIVSLIFGNLVAAILSIFFSVVFAIMGFKVRRLRLKAGPFEAEVSFK
jgi:uncharacterized protein YacL